jgi:hypothetical protein
LERAKEQVDKTIDATFTFDDPPASGSQRTSHAGLDDWALEGGVFIDTGALVCLLVGTKLPVINSTLFEVIYTIVPAPPPLRRDSSSSCCSNRRWC